MDMEERESRKPIHSHNCYVDEQTRYKVRKEVKKEVRKIRQNGKEEGEKYGREKEKLRKEGSKVRKQKWMDGWIAKRRN